MSGRRRRPRPRGCWPGTGRRRGCRRPRSPGGGSRRCPRPPRARRPADQLVVLATRSRTKMFANGVVVGRREVVGVRLEDDVAAVGRDVRVEGVVVRPGAPGPVARLTSVVVSATRSRTKMFVNGVVVLGREVVGVGREDDVATVAGDRGAAEIAVARGAARRPRRGCEVVVPRPRPGRRRRGTRCRPRPRGCLASLSKATCWPLAEIEG